MYECDDKKAGKVDCWDCQRFMQEADCCLEDSMLMPLYKTLHPDRKPVQFVKRDTPRILMLYLCEIKKPEASVNQRPKEAKE